MKSDTQYKLMEFSRRVWIYALLIAGSLIFAWPFLWMATTSVKVDREMFGDKIHLWPQRPIPQARSPYIDERYYDDVTGQRMAELLPVLETHIEKMNYPWPADIGRAAVRSQSSRSRADTIRSGASQIGRDCF